MLKIKDEVNLKELEKFGFKESDWIDKKATNLSNSETTIELYDDIYNRWNTRKIYVIGSAFLDTVYDLIQAGLVEKVSDR